jgi:hypothetical protein
MWGQLNVFRVTSLLKRVAGCRASSGIQGVWAGLRREFRVTAGFQGGVGWGCARGTCFVDGRELAHALSRFHVRPYAFDMVRCLFPTRFIRCLAGAGAVCVGVGAGNVSYGVMPPPSSRGDLDSLGSLAATPSGATVPELVQMLDAPDFRVREGALQALKSDQSITLTSIEKVLSDLTQEKKLTAEQSLRLSSAAFVKFTQSPRAAMGVQFSMQDVAENGVEINAPIDGFDASRVLQAGDVVTRIDATPVYSQNDMRAAIVSYAPGDIVTLKITRDGSPLTVPLKMGNYADLRQREAGAMAMLPGGRGANFTGGRSDLDASTLSDAWALRCERLRPTAEGAPGSRVIESGLTDGQWLLSDDARQRRRAALHSRMAGVPNGIVMRQGNGWRIMNSGDSVRDESAEFVRNRDEESRKAGLNRERFFNDQPVFVAGVKVAELQARSVEITQRLNDLRVQLRWYSQQMQVPQLPAEDRRALEQMAMRTKQEISSLESEQRTIDAQIHGP